MAFYITRNIQKLAAVAALTFCASSSATAGLFCNLDCCQGPRAYYSPACEPAWGYHQTCWRQFPEVEPCSGWGDYCPSCQTDDGGVVNAGGYPANGMQMAPNMQLAPNMKYQSMPPVMQGPPTVIQQPAPRNYAAPMQQSQSYPTPNYNPPIQSAPGYGQPMQAMPSFDSPIQMNQNFGAPRNNASPALQPVLVPEPELAPAPQGEGVMPPLPNAGYQPNVQNRYRQASQPTWQQPAATPIVQPSVSQKTSVPAKSSTQGLPVRGISFSRVRPTSSAAPQKRTLLQRLLPGGK